MTYPPNPEMNFDSHSAAAEEAQLLAQLREALLSEDREAIRTLREQWEDDEVWAEKVAPVIQKHLSFLKENFHTEYGDAVRHIVNDQLTNSQDEIINIIYPRLNTIIKKYITAQFQILKEGIDNQVKSVQTRFSPRHIFSRFFGASKSDIIMSQLDHPEIQEVYLIQRDTGLLLGSYSKEKNMDQDVIAGMLTAIKSFVEDAFSGEEEHLEMIQYENYKIFLQNFPVYYFAIALTGSISTAEKAELSNKLFSFAQNNIPFDITTVDSTLTNNISKELNEAFHDFAIQA